MSPYISAQNKENQRRWEDNAEAKAGERKTPWQPKMSKPIASKRQVSHVPEARTQTREELAHKITKTQAQIISAVFGMFETVRVENMFK